MLTFYVPSCLLVVFCTAIIVHAFCTLSRRSAVVSQSDLERSDAAKHRLLSVTSGSGGPSSADVERARTSPAVVCYRRLTVLTLVLVFAGLGWGSAVAAAGLLERRRTLVGSVAACFYAVCTSTVALLLTFLHPPTSNSPQAGGGRSWRTLIKSGCLEQLTRWRNFADDGAADDVTRQPSVPATKQVVYSIASSAAPTVRASDELDCVSDNDGQEVLLGVRDCTGSSCSVAVASLSVAELAVGGECGGEECWCCRSPTDGSTDGRCLSRNSTRMRDFDDLSCWSSSDDDCPAEGGWWNSDDGCSVQRAPCPSPASACTDNDEEESGPSRRRHAGGAGHKRSCVGATPDSVKKTRRRCDNDDDPDSDTGHITRRSFKTKRIRRTDRVRASQSVDNCSPAASVTRHKRRRVTATKTRRRHIL